MERTISLGLLSLNDFLTLTEADIYWAGSLLPEILLTVHPTTDIVYLIHKISTNVDKYRL